MSDSCFLMWMSWVIALHYHDRHGIKKAAWYCSLDNISLNCQRHTGILMASLSFISDSAVEWWPKESLVVLRAKDAYMETHAHHSANTQMWLLTAPFKSWHSDKGQVISFSFFRFSCACMHLLCINKEWPILQQVSELHKVYIYTHNIKSFQKCDHMQYTYEC